MITTMLDEMKTLRIDREVWKDVIRQSLRGVFGLSCANEINVSILVPNSHKRTLNVRLEDWHHKMIAKFSLSFLPGCKGVLVLHRMEVSIPYQRRGVANALASVKERIARDLNVSMLMCTVLQTNTTQQHILQNHNWHWVSGISNKRTGNKVYLYTKTLP